MRNVKQPALSLLVVVILILFLLFNNLKYYAFMLAPKCFTSTPSQQHSPLDEDARLGRTAACADDIFSRVNFSSPIYSRLRAEIVRLKVEDKPLLVKINSHPCAGKSYFIESNNRTYRGLHLIDFDWHLHGGANRTSELLLNFQFSAALFGTAIQEDVFELDGGNEKTRFGDVIYLHVLPPKNVLEERIQKRLEEHDGNAVGWANPEAIYEARSKALSHVCEGKHQFEPLFPTFEEALQFCVDTYNGIEAVNDS